MTSITAYLIHESLYHGMVPVLMLLLLYGVCEKKRGFAGFAVFGAMLILLVAMLRLYTSSADTFSAGVWQTGVLYFIRNHFWHIFFAAAFVYVKRRFVCTWLTALFCFLTGYCTLQMYFGAAIYIGLDSDSVLGYSLLQFALAAALMAAVRTLFYRKMNQRTIMALQKRHKAPLLLLFLLAFALGESSVRVVLSINTSIPGIPPDTQLPVDVLRNLTSASANSMLTNIIGNLVVLFALYHMLAYTETDLNEELFSTMYRQERAQYGQFKQNVDYINSRYHDLKHILTLIKSNRSVAERMLDDIAENVGFLQSEMDTGDKTLDSILTDRYIHCRQSGIELHLMTDGTTFEWIDTVDLYLIFCNMLDNAIEYLETVTEERRISMGIKTAGQMIFIHQEYGLYGDIRTVDGIPVSTKGEAHDHGFGIRSIIATVERYSGNVTVSAQNGKFSVDIIFQKPQETE